MLENTKTTHWHCKTLLQLSPIILSVLFECPIFLVRFFLFDFLLQLFCSIYLNADFFLRYFWLIYLSDFFVLFFLFAFSSDFLSLECTIFCPIYLSDFLSDLCECPIFSPNFLSNFLSKLFECSLFSSDFFVRVLSDSMVRITQLQCPASLSLKSMAKLNWLNRNFLFHV